MIIINRKKVLIIITKADWAGAQRVVYEIAKYVISFAPEIELDVAVGYDGLLVDKLKELGVNTIILNSLVHSLNPKYDFLGYRELIKLIKNNKYDVVHTHSTKAGLLGRYAASKCNVKNIIFTVHGWWPILQYTGIVRKAAALIEKSAARKCDNLVFMCEKDIELSRVFKIGNESQFKKIYNSITIGNVKSNVVRKEFGISQDAKVIGNVARIDKQKNPMLFLDIASEHLNKNDKDTYYFWVGDGPMKREVEDEIKRRKLEDNVKFIGFRENGLDYINVFDVLLMTSEAEGMPITILEAIALHKPIISTDVGGIKEIIGEANIYSKEDDKNSIVTRIKSAEYKCLNDMNTMHKSYVELYLSK